METLEVERPKFIPKTIINDEIYINTIGAEELNDNVRKNKYYKKSTKRIFEALLLVIIIIPALILILFIFVILLFTNKGKVVFKQKRVGLKGRPFTLYKFRTLAYAIDTNIEKNPILIKKNTHPFGYFLRKTGLDEILQIFNVLKGDMNIIGPRPLLMRDLSHLSQRQFAKRHRIKPGILGLWQIKRNYRDDMHYFRYDNFYFKKQSIVLDIYIIFKTFLYMLNGKGR